MPASEAVHKFFKNFKLCSRQTIAPLHQWSDSQSKAPRRPNARTNWWPGAKIRERTRGRHCSSRGRMWRSSARTCTRSAARIGRSRRSCRRTGGSRRSSRTPARQKYGNERTLWPPRSDGPRRPVGICIRARLAGAIPDWSKRRTIGTRTGDLYKDLPFSWKWSVPENTTETDHPWAAPAVEAAHGLVAASHG